MNKKGFAISVVLYSMVILVIGIFYLLLGIVRNRYTVGDTFKEQVINGIESGGPLITDLGDIVEEMDEIVEEDDGTKYIVGEVDDNYVWYSGKLWRIVGINADESIKLVTQGNMTIISWSGYDYVNNAYMPHVDYMRSYVYSWLNDVFEPTLSNATTLVEDTTLDYTIYPEATSSKLTPVNILPNKKVGLLTIYDYYKVRNGDDANNFLNNGHDWWTMSPNSLYDVWKVSKFGECISFVATGTNGIRPVINLKNGVEISGGSGTKNNPYTIAGDKKTGITGESLNNRISGEYTKINNTLYRIVGVEEINGQKLTKVTMGDYSKMGNSLIYEYNFRTDINEVKYSLTDGIGLILDEWYRNDGNSEAFKNIYPSDYLGDVYRPMIASSDDYGIEWYTGSDEVLKMPDYTLSKTGLKVSATIGLPYYGEMFSSHFDGNDWNASSIWLMTNYISSSGKSVLSMIGFIGTSYSNQANLSVRPSFYLKPDVKISSGSGMPHDPYEITM